MAVVDPELRVQGSSGCASPMPLSCRQSSPAIPTLRR